MKFPFSYLIFTVLLCGTQTTVSASSIPRAEETNHNNGPFTIKYLGNESNMVLLLQRLITA